MELTNDATKKKLAYLKDAEIKHPNDVLKVEDDFLNYKSTPTKIEDQLLIQHQKGSSMVSLGQWSSWSAYTNCNKNCSSIMKDGEKLRRDSSFLWSYSKFKGLKVSTRSCKFMTYNNSGQYENSAHKRCIGPTHRYQQCPGFQVWYNI